MEADEQEEAKKLPRGSYRQNEDLQAYMACCHEQLSDVTCRMYEHILAELFLIPWRATRDT